MFEKALQGELKYWGWILFMLILIVAAAIAYSIQFREGLSITGMNRDVSWGFYIANFTFLVGVAASAVMLVLPYYLHHYKKFGRITILGEFLAVASVIMCILFIIVDLGKPARVNNVLLHPTPNSILFWDMIVLNGYLIINLLIGWVVLGAERKEMPPPKWIKPFIYLSIPWAVSIHTVTAFLYAGLPGRGFWLTAILAPRFLASAFAAGPAVLILLSYLVRFFTNFDVGIEARETLAKIICYAIIMHIFFFFLEVFTVSYSKIPSHVLHLKYLYFGYHGAARLVPFVWTALFAGFGGIIFLLFPQLRRKENCLIIGCILVLVCTWIDKGMAMISGGFVPNPLHEVTEYTPTNLEFLITIGIYSIGAMVLTILYKIAISIKQQVELK